MAQLQLVALIVTSSLLLVSADLSAESAAVAGPEQLGGDDSAGDFSPDKRYMRFGRTAMKDWYMNDGDILSKRYMRFGRSGQSELDDQDLDEEKRYMRFGRAMGKRYMRFGRDGKDEEEKRYMRFGRSREDDGDLDEEKRYMRFGRNYPQGLGMSADKRYMRFGRAYLLSERPGMQAVSLKSRLPESSDALAADKRYMRFGRSNLDSVVVKADDDDNMVDVHFGKAASSDKQGKNEEVHGEEKRYMRFGRSQGEGLLGDDEVRLSEDKRYMRFGR